MSHGKPSLLKMCLAEFVGTYLLVLLGCGAVHAAVLTGAQSGLWQVAIIWGIAIMLAVYTVGAISGAMTEIRAATVRPMNNGAKPAGGAAELRSSVTAKTTIARIKVPNTSARKAVGSDTNEFNRSWVSTE